MSKHWDKLWNEAEKKIQSEIPEKLSLQELIERAEQRDRNFERSAIEMDSLGDHGGCWYAMASRAENARALYKFRRALEATKD